MNLTPNGLQLLLDAEVGGGRPYYEKHCLHPIVPDPENTSSGVTIGIGFDLGQCTRMRFRFAWEDYLPEGWLATLEHACGVRGKNADEMLPQFAFVSIPWETALTQFLAVTLPRYSMLTEQAFPGLDKAPQAVQEALLSLVFNRGGSMSGERRIEMRAIRDLVASKMWSRIPLRLRDMQRLWPATRGLRDRREAEAVHIEKHLTAEGAERAERKA